MELFFSHYMNLKTKPVLLSIAISSILFECPALAYTATVAKGATVYGETITGSTNAVQNVHGTANDTTIMMGTQSIQTGGVANNTTINAGQQSIYAGGTSNEVILNGGMVQINGVLNGITATGGKVIVNAGQGGATNPYAAGQLHNAVLSNAAQLVNRFGIDYDTVVNAGGLLETGTTTDYGWKNSAISNNAVINANGRQTVDNGGTSNGSTVNVGGVLTVKYDTHKEFSWDTAGTQYGTANGSIVYGVMNNSGAVDNATVIKSGGQYTATGNAVDNRIATSYDAVIESGGGATLYKDAVAAGWNIQGRADVNSATASIKDSTVNGGSLQITQGTANGIVINGGIMRNVSGQDVNTVVNSGSYSLGGTLSASSSHLTVNDGGRADVYSGTLTDAEIGGAMFVTADPSAPESTSTLLGHFAVNEGGTLNLSSGINALGANFTVSDSGAIYLSDGAFTVTHALNAVTLNGGRIVFMQPKSGNTPANYATLTLDSLSGSGQFIMNTSLAGLRGNLLKVTGQANGSFGVHVADTGVSPTSDAGLLLVKTGGGNADFTLANAGAAVDLGTYQYRLVGDGNGAWTLTAYAPPAPTPEPQPEPDPASDGDSVPDPAPAPLTPPAPSITPSTAAVLSMATTAPMIFETELNPVRARLDQTRTHAHGADAWGSYITRRISVNSGAGAGYDMDLNGLAVGADATLDTDSGALTKGIFFSYSRSDVDFDRQGSGDVTAYSIGAYTSYLHNDGFYLDGIVKVNRFENDVNARMTSGASADGSYNSSGIGASVQGGKYFYAGKTYFAPYLSITGFMTDSSRYRLSNGMQARIDAQRSLLAEGGINVGHEFSVKSASVIPYLKLAAVQEFANGNDVKVNDDRFVNDLSGTRGVYQFGVNARLTPSLSLHVDAGYMQGSGVESPWAVGVGGSWSF